MMVVSFTEMCKTKGVIASLRKIKICILNFMGEGTFSIVLFHVKFKERVLGVKSFSMFNFMSFLHLKPSWGS